MPNWCNNEIVISGSNTDIKALQALVGDEFDFNKIITMPIEMERDTVGDTGCNVMVICDTESKLCHLARGEHGGREIMEIVNARMHEVNGIVPLVKAVIDGFKPCEECLNITTKDGKLGQGLDFPLEKSIELFKEHGTDNWYDWRIKNWGTKWTASDVDSDFMNESATFRFNTAWSPPQPIYDKLCDLFPDLDIKWHWGEPGCGQSGDLDTGKVYDYQCDCDDEECYYCHPENIED